MGRKLAYHPGSRIQRVKNPRSGCYANGWNTGGVSRPAGSSPRTRREYIRGGLKVRIKGGRHGAGTGVGRAILSALIGCVQYGYTRQNCVSWVAADTPGSTWL